MRVGDFVYLLNSPNNPHILVEKGKHSSSIRTRGYGRFTTANESLLTREKYMKHYSLEYIEVHIYRSYTSAPDIIKLIFKDSRPQELLLTASRYRILERFIREKKLAAPSITKEERGLEIRHFKLIKSLHWTDLLDEEVIPGDYYGESMTYEDYMRYRPIEIIKPWWYRLFRV